MNNARTSPAHLPSTLAAILFLLSGLFLLGVGLFMGLTAFFSLITGQAVQAQQTILFFAFSFEAMLLFTAAYFSFQKILQKEPADRLAALPASPWLIVLGMVVAAGAILIGSQINSLEPVNWLVLPILTVPAVALPLAVLLALGARRLPFGTRWQTWSVLGLAMSLVPLVLFLLETVLALVVFIGVAAYVASKPELVFELRALSEQVMILGPQSEAAVELLSPLLTRPGVVVTALIYIAVLVPAIEELIKPLGVWLLGNRLNSAAQGFSLGALSGVGYGLIETVGVSGQTGEWTSLLVSRIGTGLLHITTSALMGAAIVLAVRERRYARLLGTYFIAVLLHGTWNALATLYTFSNLARLLEQPGRLGTIQPVMVTAMSILAAILFAILILSRRVWARTSSLPHSEVTVSENRVDEAP